MENTEKYITFSIPIKNKLQELIKKGNEIIETEPYRLQFFDSARFMASSLANLVNNLADRIHKIKCKYEHDAKKFESCRIK